jgi:hypothetical protein
MTGPASAFDFSCTTHLLSINLSDPGDDPSKRAVFDQVHGGLHLHETDTRTQSEGVHLDLVRSDLRMGSSCRSVLGMRGFRSRERATTNRAVPSRSNPRTVNVSIRCEIPPAIRFISLKRFGAITEQTTISTVHLSPTRATMELRLRQSSLA